MATNTTHEWQVQILSDTGDWTNVTGIVTHDESMEHLDAWLRKGVRTRCVFRGDPKNSRPAGLADRLKSR